MVGQQAMVEIPNPRQGSARSWVVRVVFLILYGVFRLCFRIPCFAAYLSVPDDALWFTVGASGMYQIYLSSYSLKVLCQQTVGQYSILGEFNNTLNLCVI